MQLKGSPHPSHHDPKQQVSSRSTSPFLVTHGAKTVAAPSRRCVTAQTLLANNCTVNSKTPATAHPSARHAATRRCTGKVDRGKLTDGAQRWELVILVHRHVPGESGVSVVSLRFQRLLFGATTQQHLVWFQSPVRIECRMADQTLEHQASSTSP
jgi:hypothetical protein